VSKFQVGETVSLVAVQSYSEKRRVAERFASRNPNKIENRLQVLFIFKAKSEGSRAFDIDRFSKYGKGEDESVVMPGTRVKVVRRTGCIIELQEVAASATVSCPDCVGNGNTRHGKCGKCDGTGRVTAGDDVPEPVIARYINVLSDGVYYRKSKKLNDIDYTTDNPQRGDIVDVVLVDGNWLKTSDGLWLPIMFVGADKSGTVCEEEYPSRRLRRGPFATAGMPQHMKLTRKALTNLVIYAIRMTCLKTPRCITATTVTGTRA